jgi:hypothetical protein
MVSDVARFHQFVADTPFRTRGRDGRPVDLRGVEQVQRESRAAQSAEDKAAGISTFKPRNRGR